MQTKVKKSQKKAATPQVSQLRFWLIYSMPFGLIITLFLADFYRDPIFLNNPYPFSAAFSGSTISFNMEFSEVPETIPTYIKPSLLSAIGLPKDLFAHQTCFYHNSFFNIKGSPIESDAVSLDVRVKKDSQTLHLPPNSFLCLPPEDSFAEIYVGNALTDGNKASKLLEQNDNLPIEGKSEVLVKEEQIYSKWIMFLGILFTFYPLYWAVIIAWNTVNKFTYIKK